MEQTIHHAALLTRPRQQASSPAAYEAVTRVLQVAISLVGLLVLSPAILVLAAVIKLVSPGPALYRGERVGKNEKLFTIYKFRTLRVGAEQQIGARLLRPDDPFYHRLGKFLKKCKLDEIPQLFNVIKGDMNLVGPRPMRPVFLEKFKRTIPGYGQRFSVRPGMTGLAQLRGGYHTSDRNKLRYDRLYIRNRSVQVDCTVLMLTFLKLLQRWITAGSLLCALVLFVSFVPAGVVSSLSVKVLGVQFNPLIPTILAAGVYLVLHAGRSNKWLISHSAIDRPMAAFIFVSVMAIPFAACPVTAFRGLVYLCATGFFFVFVLVNLRPDARFAQRATQLLGIAGGGVAMLGIGEAALALVGLRTPSPEGRSVSSLGSTQALTAYLVLCFPLALCEFLSTPKRRLKLLWLGVCIVVTGGVVAAGSRLGVPALIVSAGVLLVKTGVATRRHILVAGLACLLLLSLFGGKRYSLGALLTQGARDGEAVITSIQESSLQQLLIGYGTKTIRYPPASSPIRLFAWTRNLPQSTYLTLLLENGIAGLCLVAWLAVLVVREISIATRNQPRNLQVRLWGLAAAMCGLGVAAISFDVFYNLATQLLFWGIAGTALGLCVRYGSRDHGAVLVMRFGH